jgi:phosphoribosyl 1,2-cyclic phosphodiesterase
MDDGLKPHSAPAFLKVLASGSGGNCSVLLPQGDPRGGFWLIDAGLSPRRTRKVLSEASLCLERLRGVLVTHLDSDHWCPAWADVLPATARVLVHADHLAPGRQARLLSARAEAFAGPFELENGVRVVPALADHDELGSVAFRIEIRCRDGPAMLGFATDVGRADAALVDHLHGVDVLAIESNYCPRLQAASGRPWFLRKRITSGAGHLSNQECAAAVRVIGPRTHVVLLHLSRQCNRPDLAHAEHDRGRYAVTVAAQNRSTRWIPIAAGGPAFPRPIPSVHAPLFAKLLFDSPLPD